MNTPNWLTKICALEDVHPAHINAAGTPATLRAADTKEKIMFTHSMKKVALGLGLAAVVFISGAAMATERPVPQNPAPGAGITALSGMQSTQLLDTLGRN